MKLRYPLALILLARAAYYGMTELDAVTGFCVLLVAIFFAAPLLSGWVGAMQKMLKQPS